MNQQSGRSLIEILGVLTIGAVMIAAAVSLYTSTNQRQQRVIAMEKIKEVVKNTKTLMAYSGNYSGLSVGYLVNAGALSSDKPPIGTAWEVASPTSTTGFSVNISGLTQDECKFMKTTKVDWADYLKVNEVRDGPCDQNSNIVVFMIDGCDL
ncbi:MAG: hypothetical protein MJ165_00490 [Alphaproteobacteria bacterium]|nr:hypothetical protein [Alphaproteobacteria bacterium]